MPQLPDPNESSLPIPRPDVGLASYRPTTGDETAPGLGLVRAGASMEQSGNEISYAGNELYRAVKIEEERTNTLRADEAANKTAYQKLDLIAGPKNGFLNVQGSDAVSQPIAQDWMQKFDMAAQANRDSLSNDEQKQLYDKRVAVERLSYQETLLSHLAKQNSVFAKQVYDGTVESATQSAAAQWNNPDAISTSVAKVQNAVNLQAEKENWPAEYRAGKLQKNAGGIYSAVIKSALANGDTRTAQAYFKAYSQDMSANDILALSSKFKEVNVDAAANSGVAYANTIHSGDFNPGPLDRFNAAVGPIDTDRLAQATSAVESNNNQGAVSPKGAVGIMQLMPDTAKAVAAELGIPYDESRLRNDAGYNKLLGMKFQADLIRRYPDDISKAIAAYNAGPDAVDNAVKSYGNDWLAHMPAETQAYVPKVMDKYSQGTVPKIPTELEYVDSARSQFNPVTQPEEYKAATERAKSEYALQLSAYKQNKQQVYGQAQDWLIKNNYDFKNLPAELHDQIEQSDPESLAKLQDFAIKGQKQGIDHPPTEEGHRLFGMMANDDWLKTHNEADIMAGNNMLELGGAATDRLIENMRVVQGKPVKDPLAVLNPMINAEIEHKMSALPSLQTKGMGPKTTAEALDRKNVLRSYLRNKLLDYQKSQGEKLDLQEGTDMVDKIFAQQTPNTNNAFLSFFGITNEKNAAEVISQIPPNELTQIKNEYARKGITDPSEQDIINLYQMAHK